MRQSGSKTEKRAKHRRHSRGAAFYVLPLILVMTILLIVLLYKLCSIETITVDGVTRYHTGEIIAASGLQLGGSMFRVKPSGVDAAIEKQLSYIGDATLRFELPSTIILQVKEAEIACSVRNGSGYLLLSDSFKILQEDSPIAHANVPQVSGIVPLNPKKGERFAGQNEEDAALLETLLAAIRVHAIPGVQRIDLSNITDITLYCERDIILRLGGPGKLDYKLEFITEVMHRTAEEQGGLSSAVINAQALDGDATPSVSVLSSARYASAKKTTGAVNQEPRDTG